MARSKLTKTNRLRASAKRRRLKKGDPGAILILNQARLKKTVGGKKQAFSGKSLLEIGVKLGKSDELEFDGDIRKLTERIQFYLATHFSKSLLAGVDPNTGRALPKLSPRTDKENRRGGFGVKSGDLAKHWVMGPIRGGTVRAKASIWPSDDPFTRNLIGRWLGRSNPVDLQSVDGGAAAAITQAIDDWMESAIGSFVTTPPKADTGGGKLSDKS